MAATKFVLFYVIGFAFLIQLGAVVFCALGLVEFSSLDVGVFSGWWSSFVVKS